MSEEIRAQSYVGFDSITQQIEHKLLKRGFQFNVIVVGEFQLSTLSLYQREWSWFAVHYWQE
jgi:septin 3/9/12